MKYALLYSSIVFNVLTNIGFKLSSLNEGAPVKKWGWFSIGLVFGLINSYLFTESLKYVPLQTASAIFFSLTILGLFLASHFMFNETFPVERLIGGGLIIAGVIVISLK
ncbi:MAG TPA: SMR family transporter [Chitinophagales bacterium]|nr:SMR family transporter [Chitinophagales bacterium]